MLDTHGFDKAIIVGHSLGTVVAGWMATYAMNRITGLVLIDPVCFLLNYHDTAFNVLHRIPILTNVNLIHYFASRELHINYYFDRHFHWYLNSFFIHDIVPTTEAPTLLSSFSPFTSTRSMDKHPLDSKKLTLFNNMNKYGMILATYLVGSPALLLTLVLTLFDRQPCYLPWYLPCWIASLATYLGTYLVGSPALLLTLVLTLLDRQPCYLPWYLPCWIASLATYLGTYLVGSPALLLTLVLTLLDRQPCYLPWYLPYWIASLATYLGTYLVGSPALLLTL
ncbi:hypothetical protein INT45_010628, partial [Circinella minor]